MGVYFYCRLINMNRDFSETFRLLCIREPRFLNNQGKLNETKAGRELKINQATMQRLLSGYSKQPKENNLAKIRKFFKVSTDQLMGNAPIASIDDMPTDQPIIATENKYLSLTKEQQGFIISMIETMVSDNKKN